MNRKYAFGIGLVVVVALISFKLVRNKETLDDRNRPTSDTALRIPVKVAPVVEQLMDIAIKKTGTLAPFKEAKVMATGSGLLTALDFKLGDRVRRGQVLAQLDNRLLELDVQKAATDEAKLKNDLQTYSELYDGHAATQEKVAETRQDYKDAVSQYDKAQKALDDAGIKAPTDGIIASKDVEQGVYITPGTVIATVVNVSEVKAQVYLTEKEIYRIKTGQRVGISTDVYPNVLFYGRVSFISPQADATHSYLVEMTIENEPAHVLYSGTFVTVDLSQRTAQKVLLVPREALGESIESAFVYVFARGRAERRAVTTGQEVGDRVEILRGLGPADTVVLSGQINLRDGSLLTVAN